MSKLEKWWKWLNSTGKEEPGKSGRKPPSTTNRPLEITPDGQLTREAWQEHLATAENAVEFSGEQPYIYLGKYLDKVKLGIPRKLFWQHLKIYGTTGSGKTNIIYLLMLGLLESCIKYKDPMSLLLTDTKPEMLNALGGWLHEIGYKVVNLDFTNPSSSVRFNFLSQLRNEYLSEEEREEARRGFAQVWVDQCIGFKTDQNGLIHDTVKNILYVLVTYINSCDLYESANSGNNVSRTTVYLSKLMMMKPAKLLAEVRENPASPEIQALTIEFLEPLIDSQEANIVAEVFAALRNCATLIAGSTAIQEVTGGTKKFESSEDREDELDLGEMTRGLVSLFYTCVYERVDSIRPLTAAFFDIYCKTLVAIARKYPDRKLPIPVINMLDEFTNLGYIPNSAQLATLYRDIDFAFWVAVQGKKQLDDRYGPNVGGILDDNMKLTILLRESSMSDILSLMQKIGYTLMSLKGSSVQWGESLFASTEASEREAVLPLLPLKFFRDLAMGEIILYSGKFVFRLQTMYRGNDYRLNILPPSYALDTVHRRKVRSQQLLEMPTIPSWEEMQRKTAPLLQAELKAIFTCSERVKALERCKERNNSLVEALYSIKTTLGYEAEHKDKEAEKQALTEIYTLFGSAVTPFAAPRKQKVPTKEEVFKYIKESAVKSSIVQLEHVIRQLQDLCDHYSTSARWYRPSSEEQYKEMIKLLFARKALRQTYLNAIGQDQENIVARRKARKDALTTRYRQKERW